MESTWLSQRESHPLGKGSTNNMTSGILIVLVYDLRIILKISIYVYVLLDLFDSYSIIGARLSA